MSLQRRAWEFVPDNLKTPQNDREYLLLDDVLFEPEQADFLTGYIGTGDLLSADDLTRTPLIRSGDAQRDKNQLTIGAVYVDPNSGLFSKGAFFDDLINLIQANGGLTNDQNRLCAVPYYSWTLPIDYDKHINFSRYFWTGPGSADVNGEYVTKEIQGSQTVLYEVVSGALVQRSVIITDNFLPSTTTPGTLIELTTTTDRVIYVYTGTQWNVVIFGVEDSPSSVDLTTYNEGDYIYFGSTGPNFNRPLVFVYKEAAGRWIATPVVVSTEAPTMPRLGMIWEDPTIVPFRRLVQYDGANWNSLVYTCQAGPSGVPADNTAIYDVRELSSLSDPWTTTNWWRNFEDLSVVDQDTVSQNNGQNQAVRPIVEFWSGIESFSGDTKAFRNDAPQFNLYAFDITAQEILLVPSQSTTIFGYSIAGSGTIDPVIGLALNHASTGDIQFDLTLESATHANVLGYRMFRDGQTGLCRSVWSKSFELLTETPDSQNLFPESRTLVSNSDHLILTDPSRSTILNHLTSIIGSQPNFDGNSLGLSNYRFTEQDPTIGSVIIDPEDGLLRAMLSVQDSRLSMPDVIRAMSREYNRILFKFQTKMDQLWNTNILSTTGGNLVCTVQQAADIILSSLFIGRTSDFPFYYSDMGTYVETRIVGSTVDVVDSTPQPIFIPSSSARIGASPTFVPEKFIDRDGTISLRGHDGFIVPAQGDDRDHVWLELQNRFFNTVPVYRRTETTSFSTRHGSAAFFLKKYFGNFTPVVTSPPVNDVVLDFNTIAIPTANYAVASLAQRSYALWSGTEWLIRAFQLDDIFLNLSNGEYYIVNNTAILKISRFNNTVDFDYSWQEFRQIMRREFERWSVNRNIDMTNNAFDPNDPFTWNYTSAGVEGHYLGMYKRLYGTIRPHSHPWEIQGYSIEPTWWRTTYVPTSTYSDGTPRYSNSHNMWVQLKAGIIDTIGTISPDVAMIAPIPVDFNGELLDPIALGIVDSTTLDGTMINDEFIYGDGSPAEQMFVNSAVYSFAVALAGFLMKPGVFVDTLWNDYRQNIGDTGTFRLWNAPHVVSKSTLTREKITDSPVHLQVVNGVTTQNIGLNAWVSEALVLIGADPTNDFGNTLVNTIPTLGWRTTGFINKNSTIIETISGKEIPFEDVNVLLYQAPVTQERFCSGVAVQADGSGYRVFGYDPFHPYFVIEAGVAPLVGGQVELREVITATDQQSNFTVSSITLPVGANDIAQLGILINGYKIDPRYITVTSPKTFTINPNVQITAGMTVIVSVSTTQSNPSTQMRTFVIQNRQFSYNSTASGQYDTIEYGHYFETPNDVINFFIGYGRFLNTMGWVFDATDLISGETFDWLLGSKKFATWTIQLSDPKYKRVKNFNSSVFYYSPMSGGGKFSSSFGQILNIESIQNGSYGVLDQNSQPIDSDQVMISRIEDTISVSTLGSSVIFGLRLYLTEIQHAVFFPNVTKFNDLIYDPVISLYHKTLKVDTYRTTNWNGRFEAPGFILNGNALIPNFEKQAMNITRFYDSNNPPDDSFLRSQAQNLYDYTPKSYMDTINADARNQVKYDRALRATQGTIRPQTAFIRGTRLGTENVFINEDWAWKVATFGDTRMDFVQFNIFKDDFSDSKQVVQFTNTVTPGSTILQIPGLARTPNENNPRWIIGPKKASDGAANLTFPVNNTGIPDVADYRFYLQIFNTLDNNNTIEQNFHWDPSQNINEPNSFSLLDIVGPYDPANYSDGPSAAPPGITLWGENDVGKLWWDTTNLSYLDYHGISDPLIRAREWGNQFYFRATATYASGVVTVATLNPITKEPVAHGLSSGDIVNVTDADQSSYNGTNIVITVIDTFTISYQIQDQPVTPATGDIKIVIGQVEVYEWVRSPVSPDQYDSYVATLSGVDVLSGTARPDGDDFSYTEIDTLNQFNQPIATFYFWVRSNTKLNYVKGMATADVENRLDDPTGFGLSWFAPADATSMIVFTDGTNIQDGYAIEILIDQRTLETHEEWTLISENDQNNYPATIITNKLIDSMSKLDQFGNSVPSSFLSLGEQIGSLYLPAQTVFSDVPTAISVYTNAVNITVKTIEFSTDTTITNTFILSDELSTSNSTGFWQRAEYRLSGYEDATIFDTVVSYAERDQRLSAQLYAAGDVVRVLQSDRDDIWTGDQVAATYEYDGTTWNEVGIDNWTFTINSNISTNGSVFRSTWLGIISLLDQLQQNQVIFALLREMLRQNKECDWFFKTSYITVQIFDSIDTSLYTRPSEADAIIANILDTKPFRTKIRSEEVSYSIENPEEVAPQISDDFTAKITLLFDRLSCNILDDGAFDYFGFDLGYFDQSLWDLPDLGRQAWYPLGTFNTNGSTTTFTAVAKNQPELYAHRYDIIDSDGNIVTADSLLITITISSSNNSVELTSSYALASGYTIVLYQASGFVEGPAPSLGSSVLALYPTLTAYQDDYLHAAARLIVDLDIANPCSEMASCANTCGALDGGNAEERIRYTVVDSVLLAVTTSYSNRYSGFDAGPFDLYPFDTGPTDVGDRVFYLSIGSQPTESPGDNQVGFDAVPFDSDPFDTTTSITTLDISYPVSEQVTIGASSYIYRTHTEGIIALIEINNGAGWIPLVEGVDWMHVILGDRVIELSPINTIIGAVIRFIYASWVLNAPVGQVEITSISWQNTASPWGNGITINGYLMSVDNAPGNLTLSPSDGTITVHYSNPYLGPSPQTILYRSPIVVEDLLVSHLDYDSGLGIEDNRITGISVLDSTTNHIYNWNGTTWIDMGLIAVGVLTFARRTGNVYLFNGTNYILVHTPGDSVTAIPVLQWPPFGLGTTFCTYICGESSNAAIAYPTAYAIMQNPGASS
jgi:hypothetical protein